MLRWISVGPLTLIYTLLFIASAHAVTLRILTATVQPISDGDTLTAITDNGTKLRIRLLGIDAPEIPHSQNPGQPFGEEARDCLDHLIGGKAGRVHAYEADTSMQVLAGSQDGQVNVTS